MDNLAAKGKTELKPIGNKFRIKHIFLLAVMVTTILLRVSGLDTRLTTVIAISFGVAGIVILLLVSVRKGKMIHCILWCPIGVSLRPDASFIG
jgi:hypothetical protein